MHGARRAPERARVARDRRGVAALALGRGVPLLAILSPRPRPRRPAAAGRALRGGGLESDSVEAKPISSPPRKRGSRASDVPVALDSRFRGNDHSVWLNTVLSPAGRPCGRRTIGGRGAFVE